MMHSRSVRSLGLLVLTALLAVSLSSCATTRDAPVVVLPNGYYLQPYEGNQSAIVKRGRKQPVVAPVAAYSVWQNVVTGAMGKAPPWTPLFADDRDFKGTADTRYFILHTRSGQLQAGLSEADWRKDVQALGVPKDFQIYPPLPWHQ